MNKDPHYTYTDYWPCKPAAHEVHWIVSALVLAAVLALTIAVCYGAVLVSLLEGGL